VRFAHHCRVHDDAHGDKYIRFEFLSLGRLQHGYRLCGRGQWDAVQNHPGFQRRSTGAGERHKLAGDGVDATFTLENSGSSATPYGYMLWAMLYHGDVGAAQKQVLDLQGFGPGLQHPGSVHFDWSEIAPSVTQVSHPDDTWMLALAVTSNLNSIAAEQRLPFVIVPREA